MFPAPQIKNVCKGKLGCEIGLWFLVGALVIGTAIGLYFALRKPLASFSHSVYHNVTKSDSLKTATQKLSGSSGSGSIAKHLVERASKFRNRHDAFGVKAAT